MTVTTTATELVAVPLDLATDPTHTRATGRGSRVVRRSLRPLVDLVVAAGVAAAVHRWGPGAAGALALALPPLWVVLVAACGGYLDRPGRHPGHGTAAIARAATCLALAAWPVDALDPGALGGATAPTDAGRLVLGTAAALAATTLAVRWATRGLVRTAPVRTVVAGDPVAVHDLLAEIARDRRRGVHRFDVTGVCLPDSAEASGFAVRQWQGLDLLDAAVADGGARAVILLPGAHADHRSVRRIAARLQDAGVALLVGSSLRDVAPRRLGHTTAGGLGLLHVRPAPLRGLQAGAKSLVDRSLSAVLLVATAPVLAALALVVRLDSPGPVIFRQTRVGRHGLPFTLWKLRTMRVDAGPVALLPAPAAEHAGDPDGVLFKLREDPRVTRVGRLLRRYSLDELPQLVHVVRGRMSLVGPRPALPVEVAAYSDDMRRRLVVPPGLTGLWQVSGRSDLSWEETVRLDLQYVDNWSLADDAVIALRTARAVLGHRGAY